MTLKDWDDLFTQKKISQGDENLQKTIKKHGLEPYTAQISTSALSRNLVCEGSKGVVKGGQGKKNFLVVKLYISVAQPTNTYKNIVQLYFL